MADVSVAASGKTRLSRAALVTVILLAAFLLVVSAMLYTTLSQIESTASQTANDIPITGTQQKLSLHGIRLSRLTDDIMRAEGEKARREILANAESLAEEMAALDQGENVENIHGALAIIRDVSTIGAKRDTLKAEIGKRLIQADNIVKSLTAVLGAAVDDSRFQIEDLAETLGDGDTDAESVGEEISGIFAINMAGSSLQTTLRTMNDFLKIAGKAKAGAEVSALESKFGALGKRAAALTDRMPYTGDFQFLQSDIETYRKLVDVFALAKNILANRDEANAMALRAERNLSELTERLSVQAAASMQQSANGAEKMAETVHFVILTVFAAFAGSILCLVIVGALAGRLVLIPLLDINKALSALGQGNAGVSIRPFHLQELDDIRAAVRKFQESQKEVQLLEARQAEADRQAEEEQTALMNKIADDFEVTVGTVTRHVSSVSAQLQTSAEKVASNANRTNSQSTSMSSAAEQASHNVQSVALAADQLAGSISEVSEQVAKTSKIAGQAAADANHTDRQIQKLAEAADKVGEVVNMITEIAEQTNLLALNATIEAARAGDVGKGFAVVASEVKNLANQTANATENIGQQIADIQDATRDSVEAIQGIAKTIGEINQIAFNAAAAVEQQGTATSEIARNVEQAATGTQEVSTNIHQVTAAADETGKSADEILQASGTLTRQSEKLQTEVEKFLQMVRG